MYLYSTIQLVPAKKKHPKMNEEDRGMRTPSVPAGRIGVKPRGSFFHIPETKSFSSVLISALVNVSRGAFPRFLVPVDDPTHILQNGI